MSKLAYNFESEEKRLFFLIDSKSFYASVECVKHGLNPLKAMLVVVSEADNTNGGLILAASPMAKKRLGISNVSRVRDLPEHKDLYIVQPRMNLYIQMNLKINEIFNKFTDENHLLPYSIDESILDMTHSWHLFGNTPEEVALKIQKEVKNATGIYLTVGIGNSPVLAKLSLDLDAKHSKNLQAYWHYEDIETKLWPINNLSSIWSIGKRTAKKLNSFGIKSMYDLAHYNPYKLKQKMGIMGEQLIALSWGVDRTNLDEKITPKHNSYSNSQVLPKDYSKQQEIEVVIKEIADQVASRIRHHHKQTTLISLSIGFSFKQAEESQSNGFHKQIRISPTNDSRVLMESTVEIFRSLWDGEVVRNISVDFGGLINYTGVQTNLFDQPERTVKDTKLDKTVDDIREKYGLTALMRGMSIEKGGTAIQRSNLVGGHNGGNSYK